MVPDGRRQSTRGLDMCTSSDFPPYDEPLQDVTCDGWVRIAGTPFRCSVTIGLRHWRDWQGVPRAACSQHWAAESRKWPESIDMDAVDRVSVVVR